MPVRFGRVQFSAVQQVVAPVNCTGGGTTAGLPPHSEKLNYTGS